MKMEDAKTLEELRKAHQDEMEYIKRFYDGVADQVRNECPLLSADAILLVTDELTVKHWERLEKGYIKIYRKYLTKLKRAGKGWKQIER